MEKRTDDLEQISRELEEEKKRSDNLLCELLAPQLAKVLISGKEIEPSMQISQKIGLKCWVLRAVRTNDRDVLRSAQLPAGHGQMPAVRCRARFGRALPEVRRPRRSSSGSVDHVERTLRRKHWWEG